MRGVKELIWNIFFVNHYHLEIRKHPTLKKIEKNYWSFLINDCAN